MRAFFQPLGRSLPFGLFLLALLTVGTEIILRLSPSTGALFTLTRAFTVCAAGSILILALLQRQSRPRLELIALLAAAVWLIGYSFLFAGTNYGLGGFLRSDNAFIAAQSEKAKHYLFPTDFSYRGLSSFYPPLFSQIIGKLAWLFQADAQLVRKLVSLFVFAALPPLTYWSWRREIGGQAALLFGFLLWTLPFEVFFKPYEYLAALFFFPIWRRAFQPTQSLRTRGLTALAASFVFTLYYYPFFAGILDLADRARVALRAHAAQRSLFISALGTLGFAALFASWYWLPLLMDLLRFPVDSTQQNFFNANHLTLLGLSGSWDLPRLIKALGLFSLLSAWPRLPAVRDARRLALAGVALYLLSCTTTLFNYPLLGKRVLPFVELLLLAAGSTALTRGLRRFSARLRGPAFSTAIALVLMQDISVLLKFPKNDHMEAALAAGRKRPFDSLQSEKLRHRVVLTTDPSLTILTPLFSFSQWKEHYSHPASRYDDRLSFLQSLRGLTPEELCHALRHNPYDPIDFLYVDGPLETQRDRFPAQDERVRVRLPKNLTELPCVASVYQVEGRNLIELR